MNIDGGVISGVGAVELAMAIGLALIGLVLWGVVLVRELRDARVAQRIRALFAGAELDAPPVTAEEVDTLPEPVARWLHRSGVVGRRRIRTYAMRQAGRFRTSPDGPWMPLEAEEYYVMEPPGFVWNATIRVGGMLPIAGLDTLRGGHGHMHIQALHAVTVAHAQGAEADQGSLMRWLSQMIWFPSHALSSDLRWAPAGPNRAEVRATLDGVPLVGTFVFDDEGRVVDFEAERYATTPEGPRLTRWTTPVEAHGQRGGIEVPTRGFAQWHHEDPPFRYIEVDVDELQLDARARLPRPDGVRLFGPVLLALAWNLIGWQALPVGVGDDEGVPFWLLAAEQLTRIVVFAAPFVLRERGERRLVPWLLVGVGLVVYAGSWVPLIGWPALADVPWFALAPAVTPGLFLAPLAWLARRWDYAVAVAAFLALHLAHQLF